MLRWLTEKQAEKKIGGGGEGGLRYARSVGLHNDGIEPLNS
jgi:hypothetical protein